MQLLERFGVKWFKEAIFIRNYPMDETYFSTRFLESAF